MSWNDDEDLTLDEGTVPVQQPVIRHSKQVDKILPAMLKAQKAIEHAHKDSENPHFRSSYASLNAYINACKEEYNDNGIVVVQGVGGTDALIVVATQLAHISGQWYECEMSGAPERSGPQPKGSVITYFRRYTLSALGFMGAEDDDGEGATDRGTKPVKPKKAPVEDAPPAADRAVALKAFHKEWESLVAEVEDGDVADASRNLENVFLWSQTAKDKAFKVKADYMRKLTAETIDGLTAMLKKSGPDIVGYLESDSVRESIGLPKLSVQVCEVCETTLSEKEKASCGIAGITPHCEEHAGNALRAKLKGATGEGKDEA